LSTFCFTRPRTCSLVVCVRTLSLASLPGSHTSWFAPSGASGICAPVEGSREGCSRDGQDVETKSESRTEGLDGTEGSGEDDFDQYLNALNDDNSGTRYMSVAQLNRDDRSDTCCLCVAP
jgi:hypothetical protein